MFNLVNNIIKNTISETLAKESINTLNELKNAEIKKKRLISNQKELLNLFDDLLEVIFNNNNNNNNNNNSNNNANNNNDVSESGNENESENENENESENESCKIRQINYCFKRIDKSESVEEQINLFKKIDYLNEFWYNSYYDNNKELHLKILKLKFAYIYNDIDENLFKEVFGHTFVTLADKLINTTNKEENKIIINDIEKNRDILYEHDNFNNYVIQPAQKRHDFMDAVKIVIEFNETIQLDLV